MVGIGFTIHGKALQLLVKELLRKLSMIISSTYLVALEVKYRKLCYTRFKIGARHAII